MLMPALLQYPTKRMLDRCALPPCLCRISMAGLSGARARYMAEAIKDSVLSC